MITYPDFHFASPPRTGTTWFLRACFYAGWGAQHKANVHIPHTPGSELKITLVRHPCDWLASYFTRIHRGCIHVTSVDRFAKLPVGDFDKFVRAYLQRMPGAIGEMFTDYNATSYMRIEDMPHAFIELCMSLNVHPSQYGMVYALKPVNDTATDKLPIWRRSLYEHVMDAEREMMEHFDYAASYRDPLPNGFFEAAWQTSFGRRWEDSSSVDV